MVSKKKYLLLILFRAAGLFLSVASVLITARYFGASQDRDFFVIAMSVVAILPMLVYGSLTEVFRAKFVHIREKLGTERAVDSARGVIFWISAMSAAIVLLGELCAGEIAAFFMGGRDSVSFPLLVTLIRATLPIIFLSQLSTFWIQVLNCFNVFFIPEIFGLISSVINIALVVLLFDRVGVFSLVISNYASAVLLVAVLVFIVRKYIPGMIGLRVGGVGGEIKQYFAAALPLMFVYWVGQLSAIAERKLSAGFGIGNIALLDYAQKLLSVPQSVVLGIAASILSPALAKHHANKNSADFMDELWSFYRFAVIVFAPCVFCMCFLPANIGDLLFASKISVSEIHTFGVTVMIYGFGLLGVINHIIFTQTLIAQSRGRVVSAIALVNQTMILACNVTFAYKWGILGLAMSWSVWHIFSGFALMLVSGALKKDGAVLILRIYALYLLSFLTVWAININRFLQGLGDIPQIIINLIVFIGIMYIIMLALRFEEAKKLGRYLSRLNPGNSNAKD
jgi:peptidoglycan biosynthesis protein MviN/MurJ (putative lipid II flippase)